MPLLYFTMMLIPWLCYLYYVLPYYLQMLQQNTYNKDWAYLKWLKKNAFKNTWEFKISQLFLFILGLFLIENSVLFASLALMGTYVVLAYLFRRKLKQQNTREPLVYTARIKRLIGSTVMSYCLSIGLASQYFNSFFILILLAYFPHLLILVVKLVNAPIEKAIYLKFKWQAINKLKALPYLKTIGITGSYGKTSSKNILSEILSLRFNTLPTPKNYNTPNGLLITINNFLNKFHECFIAEMGARNTGEIKELCDLVKPTYGILTIIGTAHLESFGNQANIQKTKFELIESLPAHGIALLNADDELQTTYKLKTKAQVKWFSIKNKNADFLAKDIKTTSEGVSFKLFLKREQKSYEFTTKLLGAANVYNILAACALAYELGMTISELQKAVKRLTPTEHRLELKNMGDFMLIDDSYSNNPLTAKLSLDVLKSMPGKKIIITSGMIELGSLQTKANEEYGEAIASVCDEVILIGNEQTKEIQNGLRHKHYDEKHIYIIEDIKLAFNLISELKTKETYVLLKNDLTDIYQ